MGIRHWLVDHQREVFRTNSLHGPQYGQLKTGQHALPVRGGGSSGDDIDKDPEAKAKRAARMDRFSDHLPLQLSETVGKGKGKHRRWEHADARPVDGPNKRRWAKKTASTSHFGLTSLALAA